MNISLESVRTYIEKVYAELHKELIITERISQGLSDVFINNIKSLKPFVSSIDSEEIDKFLQSENIVNFIKERQPEISPVSDIVIDNIRQYFDKYLPNYQITDVCRKSNHPEDAYLYSVVAVKGDEYACWTSWNETAQSLNYGHYSLVSRETAIGILKENFFDVTNEPEKYGIENTLKSIDGTEAHEEEAQNPQEVEVETIRRRRGR